MYVIESVHLNILHKCSTGEQARKKRSTLALKPRADVTQSPKQGYQFPIKKDLCPPNFFLKNVPIRSFRANLVNSVGVQHNTDRIVSKSSMSPVVELISPVYAHPRWQI